MKTYRSQLIKEKDETTGVEVVRLSDDVGDTIHPYFTQPLFSSDGKILLVESDRTGFWQLYSLEVDTGLVTQLTEESGIEPHRSCLDPERLVAYYFSGRILKSVELSTLRTEEIYVVPEGFCPSIPSLSADGLYLAFSYSERLHLSVRDWMWEHLYRRPRSMVIRVDLESGMAEALWGECEWISHVNISPVDADIVLFCHEGPWELVQRMWVVKASTHEVWPLVKQKRYLQACGHEFFTRDGKVVTQYAERDRADRNEWRRFNLIVNPDGEELGKFRYPGMWPTHIQANSSATLFVGDAAYPTADFTEGAYFIGLVRHVQDRAEVELLCRHDSSWQSQEAHPHPVFTPDDRHVIFTSDRGGRCNVYMVKVGERE